MVRNGSRSGQQSLEEVQGQFQAWRRQRTRGQRIPEALWSSPAISAMLFLMGGAVRYRGREISSAQLDFIRRLIAEEPAIGRKAPSKLLLHAYPRCGRGPLQLKAKIIC